MNNSLMSNLKYKVMKRLFSIVSAMAVILMFASCNELDPTTLSGDTLPVKITVTGQVSFIPKDDKGKDKNPTSVNVGTGVNVMYGIPDADGNIEFALKTVKTNAEGVFTCEIGCPAGKTMTVKVNSSVYDESYAEETDSTGGGAGKYSKADAYFFGEMQKTAPPGKAISFDLKLTPAAYAGGGFVQPK